MNGWLLVLTLANLALANAIVWFAIAARPPPFEALESVWHDARTGQKPWA